MTTTGSSPTNHQDESATGNDKDASAERLIRQIGRYIRLLRVIALPKNIAWLH